MRANDWISHWKCRIIIDSLSHWNLKIWIVLLLITWRSVTQIGCCYRWIFREILVLFYLISLKFLNDGYAFDRDREFNVPIYYRHTFDRNWNIFILWFMFLFVSLSLLFLLFVLFVSKFFSEFIVWFFKIRSWVLFFWIHLFIWTIINWV